MTEENRENKRTGIFELLKELAERIKEEIFLLAFVFALIIAFVAVTSNQISFVTAGTFIAIFLIAVISYLIIQLKKTSKQIKKKSHDYIEWYIEYPHAFQNPLMIEKNRPNLGLVHFDVDVSLKNLSSKSLVSRIYLRSPSQAVAFKWDEPKEIWKRKFAIFPVKRKFEQSLDIWEEQIVDPKMTAKFRFHGWYRPRKAFSDFNSRKEIVLFYQIYAVSGDNVFSRFYFDSRTKKINIPFKDEVKYTSEDTEDSDKYSKKDEAGD